jgi:hypothetical protein
MSFNFGIRRPIAKSRVSSGSGGREGDTFVDDYWQDGVTEKYQNMIDKPDLNAGQRAILEEGQDEILGYLFDVSEDYDAEDLINAIGDKLGEEKFRALSETFEEYSEDIEDDWDHSSGGDGSGAKKFLGRVYS